MFRKCSFFLLLCFSFISCTAGSDPKKTTSASSLPFNAVNLEDLSVFRDSPDTDPKIVGDAYADRDMKHHMETAAGSGILTIQSEESENAVLLTQFEHGDIDLQLDFMAAKGSSAELLLQGRYGVRLTDSWLKASLVPEDNAGISPSEDPGDFQGSAAGENASRSPGLWQRLEISFKAPRFDESGNKIADARFDKVILNGEVVQQDITVDAPSSAIFEDEDLAGPLALRALDGPVAIRNIRYKKYGDLSIELRDVRFRAFEGRFKNYDTLRHLTPVDTGTADSLTFENGVKDGLLEYKGTMHVPKSGKYMFRLSTGGASWFYIDSEFFMDNNESRDYEYSVFGTKYLEKGEHPFRLVYLNTDHSLLLHYEGPGIPWTPLNKSSSVRRRAGSEPMYFNAEDKTIQLRSFFSHKDQKKLYALSVGLPGELNFAYSLKHYSPLTLWRGDFADVAQMWRFRGNEQTLEPQGVRTELNGKPGIVFLNNRKEEWPDTVSVYFYTDKKYQLGENRLPLFSYRLDDVRVQDHLSPLEDNSGLKRTINFDLSATEQTDDKSLYILLASAPSIDKLPNGNYAVNDKNYYIEEVETSGAPAFMRQNRGKQQLILPVPVRSDSFDVSYTIVW